MGYPHHHVHPNGGDHGRRGHRRSAVRLVRTQESAVLRVRRARGHQHRLSAVLRLADVCGVHFHHRHIWRNAVLHALPVHVGVCGGEVASGPDDDSGLASRRGPVGPGGVAAAQLEVPAPHRWGVHPAISHWIFVSSNVVLLLLLLLFIYIFPCIYPLKVQLLLLLLFIHITLKVQV